MKRIIALILALMTVACLFVACGVADTSLGAITKKILPFIAALLVVVALVTICEPISLFLPKLLGAM